MSRWIEPEEQGPGGWVALALCIGAIYAGCWVLWAVVSVIQAATSSSS